MKFEFLSPENRSDWNKVCETSDEAWFWHTAEWVQYSLEYRPDLKSENKSFLAYDLEGKPVGICVLQLETTKAFGRDVREFAFGGWPLPPPAVVNGLNPKRKEEITKAIYQHVDMLAAESGVERCLMRISPLTPTTFNTLVKYGYLDLPYVGQIIDCSQPVESIRKNYRKGHLSDSKRALKELKIMIFDSSSITDAVFRAYEDLHVKVSGRRTRPQSTFDMMLSMIKRGNAILVSAQKDDTYVSFTMVMLYKKRAYYASAATDPDYGSLPASHGIQWMVTEWLHGNGYDLYDLGFQRFSSQLYEVPTEKELTIAHFKRGFGSRSVPLFTGEKFFTPRYAEESLTARLRAYLESISKNSSRKTAPDPSSSDT